MSFNCFSLCFEICFRGPTNFKEFSKYFASVGGVIKCCMPQAIVFYAKFSYAVN